jgi:hypothetical protein
MMNELIPHAGHLSPWYLRMRFLQILRDIPRCFSDDLQRLLAGPAENLIPHLFVAGEGAEEANSLDTETSFNISGVAFEEIDYWASYIL